MHLMTAIIVNGNHPHWSDLTEVKSIRNFLLDCIYDGIAESKTREMTGTIEPDTVKMIKDKLLRIAIGASDK